MAFTVTPSKGKKRLDPGKDLRPITSFFSRSSAAPRTSLGLESPIPVASASQPNLTRAKSSSRSLARSNSVAAFEPIPAVGVKGGPAPAPRKRAGQRFEPLEITDRSPGAHNQRFSRNSNSFIDAKRTPFKLASGRAESPIAVSSSSSQRTGTKKRPIEFDTDSDSIEIIQRPPLKRPKPAPPRYQSAVSSSSAATTIRNYNGLPPSSPESVVLDMPPERARSVIDLRSSPSESGGRNLLQPAPATSDEDSDVQHIPFTPRIRRVTPRVTISNGRSASVRPPLAASNSIISLARPSPSSKRMYSPSQLQNISPANLPPRKPSSSAGRSRHSQSPSKGMDERRSTLDVDYHFSFGPGDDPGFHPMDVDPDPPELFSTPVRPVQKAPSPRPTLQHRATSTPIRSPSLVSLPAMMRGMGDTPPPSPPPVTSLPATLHGVGNTPLPSPPPFGSVLAMTHCVGDTPPPSPPGASSSKLTVERFRRSVSRRLSQTPSRRQITTPTSNRSRRSVSSTASQRLRREVLQSMSDESDSDIDMDALQKQLDDVVDVVDCGSGDDGGAGGIHTTGSSDTDVISDSEPEGAIPRVRLASLGLISEGQRPALSQYSSMSTLTSLASTPQRPSQLSTINESPLTDISALSPRRLFSPTQRSPSVPVSRRSHTPQPGEPTRIMLVLPTAASVARAGLKHSAEPGSSKSAGATAPLGANRRTDPSKLVSTKLNLKSKATAPPLKPARSDGASFLESLLESKRQRELREKAAGVADKIAEEKRKEALAQAERKRKRFEAEQAGVPLVEEDAECADSEDSEDERAERKKLDESTRRKLDDEARQTYDALWEAGAENARDAWCERVGYFPFWEASAEAGSKMEVLHQLPDVPSLRDVPVYEQRALLAAAKSPSSLLWYLNLDTPPATLPLLAWMFDIAFYPGDTQLAAAAWNHAHRMAQTFGTASNIPISIVFKPLIRLGASREAVDMIAVGVFDDIIEPNWSIEPGRRDELVHRWIALMQALVCADCIAREEVHLVMMMVLLVAMDKKSSSSVHLETVKTVDAIIQHLGHSGADSGSELHLLRVVHSWAQIATLPIRARLLELVCGGRASMRFGRWLAFSFLTQFDLSKIDSATYSEPPPINDLVPLLSVRRLPDVTSGYASNLIRPFQLSNNTDFIAMCHHTEILGWVLTNVQDYGASVKIAQRSDLPGFLVELQRLLGRIQHNGGVIKGGNIDATAAHQALQRIQMRVHAEIERFMKGATKAPRNIFSYLEDDVGVSHDMDSDDSDGPGR
ncbi:hypothetical protein BKA62DRAFT_319468 [Auriculariales sp. MPI-PUGE-AT-0066]|nr:hypothetical protein BKA62DRAFT_319468 [Auriculariales sp. MPI-PUGE-AT-0066]